MRGRYPFLVLAVLALALGAGNALFTVHQVATNNRQFCSLLVPATTPRLAEPVDPKATPTAYQAWVWQQRYLSLSKSFGCEA